MFRRLSCGLAAALTSLLAWPPTAVAAPCWRPPVTGTIIDPFREPPCPYCPGNRGLEYRITGRSPVQAVESGVVSWAGLVAGERYVVVRHGNGWRATYGRLASASLRTGDVVLGGQRIGDAEDLLYFGLRDGFRYIDPAPFLGELVGRWRLIPTDGRDARPPPAPRVRCG